MLRELSVKDMIFWNICLMLIWHSLCFIACVYINTSYFNPDKKMYQAKKWEKNGKWYVNKLHIKKWKDILPQHVGKGGFSKKSFTDTSIKYIDDFLVETCRGEWDHSMCCIYCAISMLINSLWPGIVFLFFTLLINLPFIAIQRYNRFRLQILKKKLLRDKLNKAQGI